MMEKWEEDARVNRKGSKPLESEKKGAHKWREGVMVIKYTMNRGLYGGCGGSG